MRREVTQPQRCLIFVTTPRLVPPTSRKAFSQQHRLYATQQWTHMWVFLLGWLAYITWHRLSVGYVRFFRDAKQGNTLPDSGSRKQCQRPF